MRIISTKTHGYLDYTVGILLIAAPWIFGFFRGGAESWVPIILGAGAILYSLITDYEMGVAKIIPMPTHLIIDVISGMFLAISPWLLGFSEHVFLPHLLVGLAEIGAGLMTNANPYGSRHRAGL